MSDLIVALRQPRTEIEEMIRGFIQKQLFSGAANWQEGIFYTVESHVLIDTHPGDRNVSANHVIVW